MTMLASPDLDAKTTDQRLDALVTAVSAGKLDGIVFEQRAGRDGRLEVDVAFDATGTGSGFPPAQVIVRLCARLSGVVGRDPQVRMVDTACASSLDERRPNHPDRIVSLDG
ncbi:hypothetical protein [Micromonospora narathiwatensis]|uniref:hypothetical protein n=1 Tax=Micromonospora narathiwatensis TaxID=299146 RepID=UPI0012FD3192|nr:hypothetical protein [Micromonospora narathiwatensis]